MGSSRAPFSLDEKNLRAAPPSPRLTLAEGYRKAAHMAAFWPAFLLPWLTPGQALVIAGLLLLMNMFILPNAAKSLYRMHEPGLGALEIVLYPAAVMACVAAFGLANGAGAAPGSGIFSGGKPAWYLPVGAAWFCLAIVDGFIGIACRALPLGPALPWNPRKPILAVVLATVTSLLPAWLLAHWVLAAGSVTLMGWSALVFFIVAAALAESAWFGVADNIIIPFTVCVLIPLVPSPLLAYAPIAPSAWHWSLIAMAFGLVTWALRMLTAGGSWLGALLSLLLIFANPWLFLFLAGFFALGMGATRFGFARKQALRIAEARGGKRGAAEVFGAMGMAAWMTPLVHVAHSSAALLVCIAPLIAKAMDTVSSETGKAIGGNTISLRTFRPVAPGTEGAVSLAGTALGLGAALLLALPILPLGWGSWPQVFCLLGIAAAANLFESFWGEWAARRNMDQGPHVNILLSLAAAVLAWIVWFGCA